MSGRPLRFLSLCSGVGGIDLAAEWAGMEIVGQVEIDPYCRRVLAKHWPDVKRVSDIRRVWGHDFGSVDVIAAGFPCQPASVAGQRRGAADARWLWPEVLRVIQVYQPTWVLLENVPGLISLGLDDVLTDLDAAEYEAWPLVFPAAAIGAPHLRERVFIVAHAQCLRRERRQGGATWTHEYTPECAGQETAAQLEAGSAGSIADVADANQHGRGWQERARAGDVGGATRADAPREGHPQRDTAQCGGEDVAHAASQRTGEPDHKAYTLSTGGKTWAVSGRRSRTGVGQADACGTGPQGTRHVLTTRQPGQAPPRLGGESDGLSGGMDGCVGHRIEPAPRHPWPVGPGEVQPPWEAPRTVTGTVPDRAARLKALGNAVVPQQVYPILAAMVAASEAMEVGA